MFIIQNIDLMFDMVICECVIEEGFFEKMIEFAKKYPHTEWGGMLLGNTKDSQVRIYGCIFPPQKSQRSTYCEFDGRELIFVKNIIRELREKRGKGDIEKIVGWIHTHPNLGLFLSGIDKNTFEIWSALNKDAVAIVVDPYSKERVIAFSSELKKIKLRLERIGENEDSNQELVELHMIFDMFGKEKHVLIIRDIEGFGEEEILKIPSEPSMRNIVEMETKKQNEYQLEYQLKIAKLESHIKVIQQRISEIEYEIKELNSIIGKKREEGISVVIRRGNKRNMNIRKKIESRV